MIGFLKYVCEWEVVNVGASYHLTVSLQLGFVVCGEWWYMFLPPLHRHMQHLITCLVGTCICSSCVSRAKPPGYISTSVHI